jgi:hypothetical protein
MSGRIAEDRPGYTGYDCNGLELLVIDCIDCEGNKYRTLPSTCAGGTSVAVWVDYRQYGTGSEAEERVIPTELIPDDFERTCKEDEQYEFTKGYLEVEYPDVPPVSVRGISLKYNTGGDEDTRNCVVCPLYERFGEPDDRYVYYRDHNNDVVKLIENSDFLPEPVTVDASLVSDTHKADCYVGESTSQPDVDDVKTVTFIECPCDEDTTELEFGVVTAVRIDDAGENLVSRGISLKFKGNRLIAINDTNPCLMTEVTPEESIIVGLSDCPAEEE